MGGFGLVEASPSAWVACDAEGEEEEGGEDDAEDLIDQREACLRFTGWGLCKEGGGDQY